MKSGSERNIAATVTDLHDANRAPAIPNGRLHSQDAELDIARVTEPIGYITQKAKAAGFKRPGRGRC